MLQAVDVGVGTFCAVCAADCDAVRHSTLRAAVHTQLASRVDAAVFTPDCAGGQNERLHEHFLELKPMTLGQVRSSQAVTL